MHENGGRDIEIETAQELASASFVRAHLGNGVYGAERGYGACRAVHVHGGTQFYRRGGTFAACDIQ